MDKTWIEVETKINAPIEIVWEFWTNPQHITNWNFASDEWCCPFAVNDIRPNGNFNWRMEAKDGSMGFDFTGTYNKVVPKELISYKMSDDRNVKIQFSKNDDQIKLIETFEAEETNSDEQQRVGWQAILDNFKKYVESNV